MIPALIACSHGTHDPLGREVVHTIVEELTALLPSVHIVQAFVDVEEPDIDTVVRLETQRGPAVVVPLLLSRGFHTETDIARAVGSVAGTRQTAPLGTHPLIAELLAARLEESLPEGWMPDDRVILAAAGSSNTLALADVELAARRLERFVPAPVSVAYASAAHPRIPDAVAETRSAGAGRVIIANHVLAPGHFAGIASRAGADIVTAPLAPDARVAAVAAARYRAAVAAG